jgi:rSAM/selenodomain-associated transferase 1
MLTHALEQAMEANVGTVELCMSPPPGDPAWHGVDLPRGIVLSSQGDGDLGERMARAVHRVTVSLGQPVLLMGTDCPSLMTAHLTQAAQKLSQHDAVLLPAIDGGYVLIGLKSACPEIFTNMPWSTSAVAALTLERLSKLGISVWEGQPLQDIDEPADLAHLPVSFMGAEFATS